MNACASKSSGKDFSNERHPRRRHQEGDRLSAGVETGSVRCDVDAASEVLQQQGTQVILLTIDILYRKKGVH
jgi:hypothetical protein